MKKIESVLLSIIVCLSIVTGITGCGSSTKQQSDTPDTPDTASTSAVDTAKTKQTIFVETYLDLICKQDFKSYAESCGFSVSEVKEDFPDLLDNIIDVFLTYTMSDEEREKFRDELKNVFSKCVYTVKDSVDNEDGSCTVPVEVNKLIVFKKALRSANKEYDKWAKKQPDDTDEMVLTDQFIEYVIEGCEEALMVPEYRDTATVNIVLTPSATNPEVFEYDPENLGSLQAALVDFGAWEKDVEDAEDAENEED